MENSELNWNPINELYSLPRILRLQTSPTRHAPCENPKIPWNGPSTCHACSSARMLSSNPKAGPFLFVPLNVRSSLLNHQLLESLLLSIASVDVSVSSIRWIIFVFDCSFDASPFTLWTGCGAVKNTNSAYFCKCFRNAPVKYQPNEISTISPFPCFFHLFTNFRFERLSILSIPVQAENADFFIWFICTFLWFFSTLCWTHPGWVFAVRVLELTSLPDKQRETEFSFSLHISQSHTIEGYEILSKHVKWHFAGGSHEMYMHWCVCVLCIVKSPW